MLHIGWFATARGSSSRLILESVVDEISCGKLDATIDFVFCSRERGESENTDQFIEQVQSYDIPLVCLSVKEFAVRCGQQIRASDGQIPEWRLEYDRRVMNKLAPFKPDICLLAGYMLIVGPEMCERYRMINLHPALPEGPKGTWQEVIWDLIESQAGESGVMMHLVTPQLDRGPVISFCRYPIRGKQFDIFWDAVSGIDAGQLKRSEGEKNQLFREIRRSGFIRETPLILQTLRSFSQNNILFSKTGELLDSRGMPISGYDLTNEIECILTAG